jgi:hypothetical protein
VSRYDRLVARGWESKNVEDQQAEAERQRTVGPPKTPEQLAREGRRGNLQLSRARTLSDLQTACNPQHRALLERTLAHLDAELAALDKD